MGWILGGSSDGWHFSPHCLEFVAWDRCSVGNSVENGHESFRIATEGTSAIELRGKFLVAEPLFDGAADPGRHGHAALFSEFGRVAQERLGKFDGND